ncbi:MAG: hypothetical protein V1846_02095 [Candidatus Komeilibacteria bacterium]
MLSHEVEVTSQAYDNTCQKTDSQSISARAWASLNYHRLQADTKVAQQRGFQVPLDAKKVVELYRPFR